MKNLIDFLFEESGNATLGNTLGMGNPTLPQSDTGVPGTEPLLTTKLKKEKKKTSINKKES